MFDTIPAQRCLMHPHPLDADELHRVAARIEDHARSLRTRARSLTAAAAGAQWHSGAATAARAHMQHGVAQLTTTATRLEHAAAALRAHARAAGRADAVLGAAGRVVGAVEHRTAGAVDTAARVVGRLL